MRAPPLSGWLEARLARGEEALAVSVAIARGSTPRDADALMLVTRSDVAGTVGGGSLEWTAIERARELLGRGAARTRVELPLGPMLGQCCGGHVTLEIAPADRAFLADQRAREAAEREARPSVLVFGAGHVGRALLGALAPLPFATTAIDSRAECLRDLPGSVAAHLAERPEAFVSGAPERAAFVILTHSHTLDYLVAEAALSRGDGAYVGMIGSRTKRARFVSWLAARGHAGGLADSLILPVGGAGVRDKRPQVIAALVAAELLTIFFRAP